MKEAHRCPRHRRKEKNMLLNIEKQTNKDFFFEYFLCDVMHSKFLKIFYINYSF